MINEGMMDDSFDFGAPRPIDDRIKIVGCVQLRDNFQAPVDAFVVIIENRGNQISMIIRGETAREFQEAATHAAKLDVLDRIEHKEIVDAIPYED